MKKLVHILHVSSLSLVVGIITSCSENIDTLSEAHDTVPLGIQVSLSENNTRAASTVSGTSFSSATSLGVSLYKEDKSGVYADGASNVKFSTSDGVSWETTTPILLKSQKGVVTAYYPYSQDLDITAISMNTSDATDWMYQPFSTTTYSAASPQADVHLSHAQALLKVIINKSANKPYNGSGNITDIDISSSSFTTSGTLNSTTGAITGTSSSVIETSWGKTVGAYGSTTALDQWFVSPIAETENATVSIKVKIDGIDYEVKDFAVKKDNAATPIMQGNIYTFTLNLSSNELTLGNVSITDWEDGEAMTGDLELSGPEEKVFSAVTEIYSSTRATLLEGNKVGWTTEDVVSINGVRYIASPGEDPVNATLTKEDEENADPEGPYMAYYPASIESEGVLTLPATQTYSASSISNIPMYASSESTALEFKNLCAILAVTVDNTSLSTVKKIRVSSSNKAMSGAFTIENNAAVLSAPNTVSNKVVLDCGTGVTLNETGTTFYIAIPAQTYKDLKIELSSNGSSYTRAMTTEKDLDIVIERNSITNLTFKAQTGSDNGHDWVILWDGGPKWATKNLGVSPNYPQGLLYSWGELQTKDIRGAWWDSDYKYYAQDKYKTIPANISGNSTYDAARYQWKGTWRMPTLQEWKLLDEKCDKAFKEDNITAYDYTITKVLVVTSKENGNSITFLPTGKMDRSLDKRKEPQSAYYWAGDRPNQTSYGAYRMNYNGNSDETTLFLITSDIYEGMAIRPVMD